MAYVKGLQPVFAIYLHPLRVWAFRRWIIHRKKPMSFAWLKIKRKRTEPKMNGKIKVLTASYDGLHSSTDVTEIIRSCIERDKLSILVDNGLTGFDPDPGHQKVLTLTYLAGGRFHKLNAYEGEKVVLP